MTITVWDWAGSGDKRASQIAVGCDQRGWYTEYRGPEMTGPVRENHPDRAKAVTDAWEMIKACGGHDAWRLRE